MRNLLNFLIRFNNLIIFLVLEGITFYLLANGNSYHNSRVTNAIGGLTRGIESRISSTRNYLKLGEINQELARENIELRNRIERLTRKGNSVIFSVSDTIYNQQYTHTSAEVIENSVNKQKNFFTINKGKRDGITTDMAVTSNDGVAGLIVGSSEDFSVAMSLLNIDFRLSVRLKSSGYFGSLSWDGRDPGHAVLTEMPQHLNLSIGDTVETTGYSAVFPEGLIVGTISDFRKPGGDFYTIRVKLKTDFKKLHFVDVIGNLRRKEKVELENQFQ